ncbi:MAG: uracil-DNA glycosylase [Eubacteriales bacterium]
MSDIRETWKHWESCCDCGLGMTTLRRSIGVGNPQAQIVVVGDVPNFYYGTTGDCAPTPLGIFLNQILSIIDLSLENVYFTTLVKCQPYENRHPMKSELETCRNHLRQQLAVLNPKLVICLGRTVGQALMDKDLTMANSRGTFVQNNGLTMTTLYHPSALLRDPQLRPATFADLKSIQSKLVELGIKV